MGDKSPRQASPHPAPKPLGDKWEAIFKSGAVRSPNVHNRNPLVAIKNPNNPELKAVSKLRENNRRQMGGNSPRPAS